MLGRQILRNKSMTSFCFVLFGRLCHDSSSPYVLFFSFFFIRAHLARTTCHFLFFWLSLLSFICLFFFFFQTMGRGNKGPEVTGPVWRLDDGESNAFQIPLFWPLENAHSCPLFCFCFSYFTALRWKGLMRWALRRGEVWMALMSFMFDGVYHVWRVVLSRVFTREKEKENVEISYF